MTGPFLNRERPFLFLILFSWNNYKLFCVFGIIEAPDIASRRIWLFCNEEKALWLKNLTDLRKELVESYR